MTPLDLQDCGGIPPTSGAALQPDTVTFTGIPADRVDDFWEQAEPLLWRAIILTGGDETLLSVKNDLRDGRRGLLAAFSVLSMDRMLMAVTTRLVPSGSGRVKCLIGHIGGDDMEKWLGFLPMIESYAREQGCVGMKIVGRKGWLRVLPDYEQTAVVMEKLFH